MAQPRLEQARRELRLRMRQAFSHVLAATPGGVEHHHLNQNAFLEELERFIDAKIREATG